MPTLTRGPAAATVLLLAVASIADASPTNPPTPAPRSTVVLQTREAVRIDGRLSEEMWATVPVVSDLLQRDPDEGKPATERTEIRVAYDENALYIGARLFDSQPKRIVRRRSRRDGASSSDFLRVYLDPHHDHKTGVMLTVSAAGSLADAWLSNDFESDTSWDGVWDAAVALDDSGWTVEMRVPFSQLRFSPGDRQTWGLNVSRFIQRTNEEDWWALVPKTDSRLVSGFGHLEGLDGVRPKRNLELLPYATVGVERAGTTAAGDPFSRPNRPAGGAGLDLKWGMTSSFTMDGTLNPDFGQVELDPAVVNLTAFETFYQEKRPFFIEGSQQFNTFGRNGLPLYGRFGSTYPSLWYSRRIGRSPRLNASGEYVDQPGATTILGAAKVTGRTAGGWNMSVVDAVTAREMAQVAVGDTRSTMEVEPLTNYAALRASRDIAGRGAFGVVATGVNRSLQTAALQRSTPGGAYTGGVDGNWFLDSRKSWVVSGSFAASHVWGDEAAMASLQRAPARYYQRPDASHLRYDPAAKSLSGWTGQVNVNRTRGNLLVDAAVWAISPGFESNDVGYSPAADRVGAHTGWIWQKTTPDRWTRDRSATLITYWLWNMGGDVVGHGYTTQLSATMKNYWSVSGSVGATPSRIDDRDTRGGPAMKRVPAWSSSLFISSDARKKLRLDASASYAKNTAGGWSLSVNPSLVYRPSSAFSVSAGPAVTRAYAVAQYVTGVADPTATETYGRRTVYSELDRTEVSMVSRLNVIFTPKMSFEVYLQPLVSSGQYWGMKELARPRAFEFTRYGVDAGTITYDPALQTYTIDPDAEGPADTFRVREPSFNYRSLRVNAVFRWEWRLGSTLYAVWTQQRQDSATADFSLARDFNAMAGAPGDNVFMVKMAYWFGR